MATYNVSSGRPSKDVTLYNSDTMNVLYGGLASWTTVSSGGVLEVFSGGSAQIAVVSSGGKAWVEPGGDAFGVSVFNSGDMFVLGLANNAQASSGGIIKVYSGGSAELTQVHNGGKLLVSASGNASGVYVSSGGVLGIFEGGVVSGASAYYGGNVIVSSMGIASSALVIGGNMDVMSLGWANQTIVSSGKFNIYSSGVADNIWVGGGGGEMNVFYGGVASTITVASKGIFNVSSGGSTQNAIVSSGGKMNVGYGGTASSVNVKRAAELIVDGRAYGVTLDLGTLNVTSYGSATDVYIYGGYVYNKGTVISAQVRDGGTLYVSSGGVANGATVISGTMYVYGGGTANSATVGNGDLHVEGSARDTLVSAGFMHVSGGTATGTTVYPLGSLFVEFNGVVTETTVTGGIDLFSGGTAVSTFLNGADMNVYTRAIASATYVSSGATQNVLSGGVASNAHVYEDGAIRVSSGGTMLDANVSGGMLYVSSGASALAVTVSSGGSVIMNGGSAAFVILDQGSMFLSSGAYASTVTARNSASVSAYSGGTAVSVSLSSGGGLFVSNGGLAVWTTVAEGGRFHVRAGGVVRGVTQREGGTVVISSGGTLTGSADVVSATVSSGGVVDFDLTMVMSMNSSIIQNLSAITGAPTYTLTVEDTTPTLGTYQLAGGAAGFDKTITVKNVSGTELGTLTVDSGKQMIDGWAYSLQLSDSGNLSVTVARDFFTGDLTSETKEINSSLHASRVNVNVEGILNIVSGGVASVTVINSGGRVNMSGGKAYDTVINSGGVMSVSHRGTASGVTVSSGGVLSAEDCPFIDAIVSGGTFFLSRGGSAFGTRVSGSGTMYIDRGSALALSVFNGIICVSSGGTASDIWVVGRMDVLAGAKVSSANVSSGKLYISSGASMVGVTVMKDGEFYLDSRADVSSVTIQTGGSMTVGIGARVRSATMTGGVMDMKASAYVDDVILSAGGSIIVSSGGTLSYASLGSGGAVTVSEGGRASGASVGAGASMVFFSGASGTTITEDGGYVDVQDGAAVQFSAHSFRATTIADAATIHSNTRMSGGMISSGGLVHVFSRGDVASVTIFDGGAIRVSSGGSVRLSVLSGGELNILEGGNVKNISAFSSGTVNVYSGAIVSDLRFSSGGILNVIGGTVNESRMDFRNAISACVKDGGVLNNAQFDGSGTTIDVSNSGVLSSAKIHGGSMTLTVFNGGVAKNTVIDGYRDVFFIVESGGSATDATIKAFAGGMTVRGDATGVSVYSSGTVVNVESGGTLHSATVTYSANIAVSEGGIAYNTVIGSKGSMTVLAGGFAVVATVNGGILSVAGEVHDALIASGSMVLVGDGALAEYTSVGSHTQVFVSSGALAYETFVDIEGRVHLFSGGVMKNVNVASGGNVNVMSGGKLTGSMYFADGASASVLSTGIVDFDLTGATPVPDPTEPDPVAGVWPSATPILNDFSVIGGSPTFTLTVSDSVVNGEYILANNAASFVGTISVYDTDGVGYGELGLHQTVTVNGREYTLALKDTVTGSDLTVTITGETPPTPTFSLARGDRDGNGVSDVMFVWTGNTFAHGYWMNGTNDWWNANASGVSPEWDNLGSYDMSGDGKADAVMFGNVEVDGAKGAYIGYYQDGDDVDGWVNIGFLDNSENIEWHNAVGNLTGSGHDPAPSGGPVVTGPETNSIVWHAPELGALGAWIEGTDTWVSLGAGYDSHWTLVGCGDFSYDSAADSVVMAYNNGEKYYAVAIDGSATELGESDSGWEVRAIGDFNANGVDDIVAFHQETGLVAMWSDGLCARWVQLGQLDAADWFVAGCGDYNGDGTDDLLVRQYSSGMLGYYSNGDMSQWNVLGYGVDMDWTVIA